MHTSRTRFIWWCRGTINQADSGVTEQACHYLPRFEFLPSLRKLRPSLRPTTKHATGSAQYSRFFPTESSQARRRCGFLSREYIVRAKLVCVCFFFQDKVDKSSAREFQSREREPHARWAWEPAQVYTCCAFTVSNRGSQ